jgi:hypothetical protein
MTVEELRKAEWTELGKGVSYISISNGDVTDSIRYEIKEISVVGINITPGDNDSTDVVPPGKLTKLLNTKLPKSSKGYLRLSQDAFLMPDTMIVFIYLNDTVDSSLLKLYMDTIRNMPYVQGAYYVSKEMAKERYLADGNNEWNEVLTKNPLPASIEVSFRTDDATRGLMNNFKQKIQAEIHTEDIIIPQTFYRDRAPANEAVMYLKYERL